MINWQINEWGQIKNISCDVLISALERDEWTREIANGATLVYLKDNNRVVVHYHPRKTFYNPTFLKKLIDNIGWSKDDLKRLKLIK
ncbi:MAG: hypothetical protein IPH11_10515 [Ignavibacteriales bacterium]|nr:hypothetical protein [Ignavibacteriales bacterium]